MLAKRISILVSNCPDTEALAAVKLETPVLVSAPSAMIAFSEACGFGRHAPLKRVGSTTPRRWTRPIRLLHPW